jgi:arylsulfatase A-like enzyme
MLGCSGAEKAAPPDVLLVVLDTVRADRVSAYGYARATTPSLDSLARTGVLFEDVTAPANWTWPAHASLFTGRPPWEHGAHFGRSGTGVRFDWGGFASPMRRDLPTLAERFAAAGYRTVFVNANPVMASPIADSITRGFEVTAHFPQDRRVLARAYAALQSDDSRPLLLVVNLMGAHNPYDAQSAPWLDAKRRARLEPANAPEWLRAYLKPSGGGIDLQRRSRAARSLSIQIAEGSRVLPPGAVTWISDLYDGELLELDAVLGELLADWDAARGDSVIAVTSDHGEYLGEHGLVEHTYLLYDEVLKVPLVLRAPGLGAGVRVEAAVQLQDLYATLLELTLGGASPDSLVSLARGAGDSDPRPIRAIAYPRDGVGVGILRFGYAYYREGDDVLLTRSDGQLELYDRGQDPGMIRDLAAAQAARAAQMNSRAAPGFHEVRGAPGAPVEVSPQAREQLQALGYDLAP